MRYAYDTEFLDDGKQIHLISIGMVAEDGRGYYAVNRDAPWGRIKHDPWLTENVVPGLPQAYGDWRNQMPKSWLFNWNDPCVKRSAEIARDLRVFVDPVFGQAKLWAYYSAYDHVALAQLFGRMLDLPGQFPMRTNDLAQEIDRLGISRTALPAQTGKEHNALDDARWVMTCLRYLDRK